MSFDALWSELAPIGRHDVTGGYRRYAWTSADMECREWFTAAAQARGLDVEADRDGNLWAWWGDPHDGDALAIGSHLDSVPDGGAFDGPLGVVSAFAAIDAVHTRNVVPTRPIGVVAFSDEEGARFGIACGGSRLLTGALDADRALGLQDEGGTTMAEAMAAGGHDPDQVGPDHERLARIGTFIEPHIEQGRVAIDTPEGVVNGLAGLNRPVGVASAIWPHGRWRIDVPGRADHAGTTRLEDREDPMPALAATILAARATALRHEALATVGKVVVEPNGVNAIPSRVTAWLDARGEDEDRVRALVADLAESVDMIEESWTDATVFDEWLRDSIASMLSDAPIMSTGAGHDAGVLSAAGVPSAMLFVRNPTGVSHSPAEHAERDDCLAGVGALATVIAELAG